MWQVWKTFLRKQDAMGPLPPETLLVLMDVTSLYTNIPHEDGIKAAEEVWETRTVKDPPTQILIKLLTLVLKCNNFEFNGRHYLQIQGTAMGTKMAPSYANLFMGRLEKQLLQSVTPKLLSWLRFIDDIDMKWIHGRETLEAFLDTVNSFHPTIRFTAEVSNDKHVFLDTTSHLVDDKVVVDLYTKPTDSSSIFYPQVSTLLIAARTYHTAWHYASDASALTMRPLRKECQISLYISTKGVIRSRALIKP